MYSKPTLLITLISFLLNIANSQCIIDTTNIYSFEYDGHIYEVVKENRTWHEAVDCALIRNGYLAEINDEEEQNAIFAELTTNAGINNADTQNQFGTASVWLGGSDSVTEGEWFWNGNNDAIGIQFWDGGPDGNIVNDSYTNWGISPAEPDNSGGQDYLTIIIKPTATNFGLWNDLISTNTIYYLIEIESAVSIPENELNTEIKIYPNPFTNIINIETNDTDKISKIEIFNLVGKKVKEVSAEELTEGKIKVSELDEGVYILNVRFENGEVISRKIVK